MAMSLEDLLAEEGFHRTKSKIVSRTSYTSERRPSMPLRVRHESSSSLTVKKVERSRSEIPRYSSKGEASTSDSFNGRRPRDTFIRRVKIESESETWKNDVKLKRRGHQDSWDGARFNVRTSADSQVSEITEVTQGYEIVEVGNNSPYKDIYLNKVYGYEESESRNSTRHEERERYRQRYGKNIEEDKKNRTNSFKHPPSLPNRRNTDATNWKLMNQPESSSKKTFDENKSVKQPKLEETLDTPALDEAAVKAVISILSGYIKRFLEDEDFRTYLRHNSFASLNFIGLEEDLNTESNVIENLEQAIETVERAAEESASVKELKKASLQLSVITGLNSNDLKDGFTSGIPNLKLSACAHLYLSVIYVIQKKDKITAKHILQVFCDSPFQARVALLPDLWDHVFLPNLLHVKLWYDKEARSLADSPVSSNLNLLDKLYNETLDWGTHQFSKYYKDWLTEGLEAPSLPVIKIPSFSVQLMPKGGLHGHTNSPASYVSPQPMVSKTLYDEVFRCAHKPGFELGIYEEENFEISARNSNSPAQEDKQLILYDSLTSTNQDFEPDGESLPVDLYVANETLSENSLGVANPDERCTNSQSYLKNSHPTALQIKFESNVQEQAENHQEFRDRPSLASIPNDFVCPLTGLIFEDPVTLETGQSFEREAIIDWFNKGSTTCPVTRKALQFQAVPSTNLILKRVIDNWKSDHFQHILVIVSQVAANSTENTFISNDDMIICILEQLLVVLSGKERVENAKRVLSLGGLQFLLKRFHSGNTKEKTFILPLFLCCIEADEECRNYLSRNISKSNLLDLLHGEQLKTVTDSVLLLTELICLNRRMHSQIFLEGVNNEELANAMDDLLIHLKTCTLEETPVVAVLLLHLNLLSQPQMNNAYRQEAVDALTVALGQSLTDEKVQKKCSRALLVLGGCFSSSAKLMTEDWILKLAGFLNGPDWDIADDESCDISFDGRVTMVDYQIEDSEEEKAREKWLVSLSASLLEDGNKPFLETVSKCLNFGNLDLVRVCLVTVAWLSSSLASLPDTEFQLYAFSALISPLKKCMERGELVEHKILASLCLLNFSKFPECRILLIKIAEEICSCVQNLAEVTWTAKELCTIISGKRK
ncbi:putative E3 ubiquitin-protein ligase LIN-1 isoform X2 [Primulina huaijiensis]|uniref:putative E3 ubiquitin-protein ligase LIN-1 isoform X2 n=1 Tax=Primulina huaijiensis TaxID=1492673 RepID=UPI003CC6E058